MVVIQSENPVKIPQDVVDLDSFRQWARSRTFPEHGWISYLRGEIWVDLEMEQLFTHNGVKTRIASTLDRLVAAEGLGYYFSDRARLSNVDIDLCTEPDGVFLAYETVRELRARFVEDKRGEHREILGSPDLVVEVVSRSSVRKDTKVLRRLYWEAGIPEYWLVDARKIEPHFDILRRGARGYTAVRPHEGWLKSSVLGRSFRLTQQPDPLGHPQYTLEVQP